MKAEHLDMQTIPNSQFNLDALYKICPQCFTEGKDADGNLRHVVDFNKLKALLGDDAVDDAPESYDFTWVGKREAQREASARIDKTLRPCVEESVDWDKTQNLYIEGDNLEVLKLLQNSYMGKVKMIYIDPPYNTGNDFVYHDDFKVSADEYNENNFNENGERFRKNTDSNGRFHSDWCSMMYARLMVARTLLSDDGVIFVSIDDAEQKNLKNICEEIFGSSNFIAQVIWERSYAPVNLKKHFSESHDYIVAYAKNIDSVICNGLPKTDEANSRYKNIDNDPRGDWKAADATVGPAIQEKCYPLELPSGRVVYPPSGRCWLYTKERLKEMIADNRVWFGVDGNNVPSIKKFASEVKQTMTPMTIWKYTEVGHSQDAAKYLKKLFDNKDYFDYPKPVELIKRCIQLYTDKQSIILDFFSGSSTTAEAVLNLNKEDCGSRKYVMVQLQERTDTKSEAYRDNFVTICDIAKERIRRASNQIRQQLESEIDSLGCQIIRMLEAKPDQIARMLPREEQEQIARDIYDNQIKPLEEKKEALQEKLNNLDVGFRVLKCDSSNMKEVYFSPQEYNQGLLFDLLDNIKEDRTDLDLLFDCMLRWGVELSLPIDSNTKVDGCTLHNVNEGDLVACFNGTITDNVIDAIAALHPLRVVFRDSSFNETSQKMNLFELFKQKCNWSDEEVKNNVRVI